MQRFLLLACFLSLWIAPDTAGSAGAGDADLLIIVNKQAAIQSTTVEEVRNLFLRKKTTWRSGGKVVPIHARDSHLKEVFLSRVLGMSWGEELEYWKNAKIKIGLTEPVAMSNPLKAVFKLKTAVSYVQRRDYNEGVAKIVLVIPAS